MLACAADFEDSWVRKVRKQGHVEKRFSLLFPILFSCSLVSITRKAATAFPNNPQNNTPEICQRLLLHRRRRRTVTQVSLCRVKLNQYMSTRILLKNKDRNQGTRKY